MSDRTEAHTQQATDPAFLSLSVKSPEITAWKLKPDDPVEIARLRAQGWQPAPIDVRPPSANSRVEIETLAQPQIQGPTENPVPDVSADTGTGTDTTTVAGE